jgi:hypothetical protein
VVVTGWDALGDVVYQVLLVNDVNLDFRRVCNLEVLLDALKGQYHIQF